MITIYLAAAVICIQNICYPILVGKDTPTGTFIMKQTRVLAPGYGGDVLLLKDDIAIHRVWVGRPEQRRLERLNGPASGRINITGGCVNVLPSVYNLLISCCAENEVRIER